MRVGVIQPNYLPWRGYLDFIDDVDLFVFYDDVQYTKNDWRNRNRIKGPNGVQWMTVPIHRAGLGHTIAEARIVNSVDWVRQHVNQVTSNYGRAEYFDDYAPDLFSIISSGHESLAALDIELTLWLMSTLGIQTPTVRSSEFPADGRKTERLIALLGRLGAATYLTGPSALSYLEVEAFEQANIALEVKSYDYPDYAQLWGDFVGRVSIIDLLMCRGPEARRLLKSQSPNREVASGVARVRS